MLLKVNMAVDMLRVQQLSMLPLEGWITAERKRKAQEEADTKELEAAAKAQVGRPRQRWCIGSGECLPRCRYVLHEDSLSAFSIKATVQVRHGFHSCLKISTLAALNRCATCIECPDTRILAHSCFRFSSRACVMPSDWHCFSKSVVTVLAANKVVSDLRRNALHVVRQVAESGAGKSSVPSPLAFHAVRMNFIEWL